MGEMVAADERGIVVSSFEDRGECRKVFVSERCGGDVCLAEVSEGPLTEALFGSGPRYHEVCVSAEGKVQLGWALGATSPCESVDDLRDHLRSFFGDGDRFLSDLMDELDAAGVPYSYMSCVPGEGVWFRPVRARDGAVSVA